MWLKQQILGVYFIVCFLFVFLFPTFTYIYIYQHPYVPCINDGLQIVDVDVRDDCTYVHTLTYVLYARFPCSIEDFPTLGPSVPPHLPSPSSLSLNQTSFASSPDSAHFTTQRSAEAHPSTQICACILPTYFLYIQYTHTHTHTRTRAHTHTHTHTHTHIHTHH